MKNNKPAALAIAVPFASVLVFGTASDAIARCSQQFSHTTCSGFGPWQKCTNIFKTVCSEPVVKHPGNAGPVPYNYSTAVQHGIIKPMAVRSCAQFVNGRCP